MGLTLMICVFSWGIEWLLAPIIGVSNALNRVCGGIIAQLWIMFMPFKWFIYVVQCIMCVQFIYLLVMMARVFIGLSCIWACSLVDYVESNPDSNTVSSLLIKLSWPAIE